MPHLLIVWTGFAQPCVGPRIGHMHHVVKLVLSVL